MKTSSSFRAGILLRIFFLFTVAGVLVANSARAGLTLTLQLEHDTYGYYFWPNLSANTNLPNFPDGVYQIASPQIPYAGSRLVYYATNGTLNECYDCGGATYAGNFDSFLYGLTNGLWTISVTNNTSTNVYYFAVTVTGLSSNAYNPPMTMVYPMNGSVNVPPQPLFQWIGPANWQGTLSCQDNFVDTNGNYNYVASANLSTDATSWTPPAALPNGTNSFSADYVSNVTAQVVASQPTNNTGQPVSSWVSTATLETINNNMTFVVNSSVNDYDSFLVARYDFEVTNDACYDSSGNNNYNDCSSSDGPLQDTFSTNAAVGNYARQFFGNTSYCFTQNDPAYNNFSNALAGNFTVTAWVKTTNSVNSDYANAYFGAPVFFAAADYNEGSTVPLSITGSKAAFTVVSFSSSPGTVTLNSNAKVNDGKYHFLAATRQQSTGLMCLYVDGNLDSTGYGITNALVTQGYISLAGGYYFYNGLLDDVRIYSTNLSAADIATIASSGNVLTLASAVGATNLAMSTSGDANWFVETTNTYNGAPAADQSGSISNYQMSVLTATVTGPGTLSFYWSSQDNDPNQYMDYEFAIDDLDTNDIADIYGANDWQSIENAPGISGPITIPPGQHTLIWAVYDDGDADPFEAGFLDDVVFTPPDTSSVSANITLDIYREQDPTFGEIYIAFPSFNSVTPPATGTTTNIISSPDGYFSGQAGSGSSSAILSSFDQLINELTNGLWSLYINQGQPNQRQFQFSVSVNGLTTNLLSAVTLIAPTNGATGFPSTGTIQWLGPSNYSTLNVSKQYYDGSDYVGTSLPVTATSWTPGLIAGTNQCNITYTSNNFPNISFSVPVDNADSQTVSNWVAQVNLNSSAAAIFVVSAGASQVTLLSPQTGGGNFLFSFQSQTGFTNTVQYRTNLVLGVWQTWTNILGDGTVKTSSVPLSLFSPSTTGFVRVSTQ